MPSKMWDENTYTFSNLKVNLTTQPHFYSLSIMTFKYITAMAQPSMMIVAWDAAYCVIQSIRRFDTLQLDVP